MTGIVARLRAVPQGAGGEVAFEAVFGADVLSGEAAGDCSTALLRPGDGAELALGPICAPTAVTWRQQRSLPLAQHIYGGPGPYTAELLADGAVIASAVVTPQEGAAGSAQPRAAAAANRAVGLFAFAPVRDAAEQRVLKLEAPPVPPDQRLRLDAGAGQVYEFRGEEGQAVSAKMLLTYPKPGLYTVSLDLLDGEGFWLATLAHAELEIAAPEPAVEAVEADDEPAFAPDELRAAELPLSATPWLPYRNFKAKAGGAATYSAPGGGVRRRWMGAGVWLTARRETVTGGARWYQTAGGDWVKADEVVFFEPSDLRGVVLDGTAPPPPPPPPPPGNRKGVVIASVLNVRARPGISASNPPVGSLRAGAAVVIYEEQQASGEIWYRIGINRWVVARFVRVTEPRGPVGADAQPQGKAALPLGWVVHEHLDVRNQPGLAAGSTIVDRLDHNALVPILEEATASGARWYRIGESRWIEGRQLGVARLKARPSRIGANELWVAVNLSEQTAVCYEGDRPVYAALIASGVSGTPTVQGIFRTWGRLDTGKMSGPGYYIEDVTWTCYFYGGYALHTAYWHDKFGRPRSHGCVNLSPYDAWWVYQWSAKGGPHSPTVYVYSA